MKSRPTSVGQWCSLGRYNAAMAVDPALPAPKWLRRPFLGLLVLVTAAAGQPLARTVNRLILDGSGQFAFWGFGVMGVCGVVVVAKWLDADELPASIAGYVGGMLVWHGLAEGCLRFFAERFDVGAVDYAGFPLDGRYALLMSTATILLGVFSLFGMLNRETRCNFMRWWQRRLHWSPGDPTPGYRRSYARIAALETVFVQWLVFLLFLYLGGSFGTAFYLGILAWSLFLLWQLIRYPRPGAAFRYAIPVAVLLFSLTEVGAFFGLYPEYWKSVTSFPISNLLTLGVFVAGCRLLIADPARR